MFRPNLFHRLTFLCLTVVSGASAVAQPHGGAHPDGYWQMPGIHVPHSSYQAPIVDYYVGQKPQVWDDQQPVEKFVGELAKRSWLRIDYLLWTLGRPGNVPIGAPVLNATDPLVVFDNQNATTAGEAVIPGMGNIGLDDSSGIRGTWGLDLANAELEVEFFGTAKNSDGYSFTDITASRILRSDPLDTTFDPTLGTTPFPNIVTPLLTNGAAADAATANYLIYDSSFETSLTSQIWGAEATLLSKSYVPGAGFEWQWLGGFRYVAYEEKFRNRGVSGASGPAPVVTTFGGDTVNNMYGPEVGFRMSAEHRRFTFSATPRIAFALNNYTAETQSAPQNTIERRFTTSDVDFTPIVQVSFTGELHLTPNFSIFGGYDFMWMYRMTRPYDNIVYDSVPGLVGGFTPNIYQDVDLESFYARGLSVGGVFRY